MSVSLPNGATVAIASAYGTSKAITAISNANPAIASATAHGFAEGDYVEIKSGWSKLDSKIVRVGAITTDTFELEGIDTTIAGNYPTGSGGGSVREATSFTQLAQILQSSSTGGEQQFLEYQFLESDAQKRIPTFKNASGLTFSVADDPVQAGYILASQANDDRLSRALKIDLPSGSVLLYNGFLSLNKTPSLTVNEIMACEVTVSLLAEPVRYAS